MSTALTNPLQALLAKAATAIPRDTGESARYHARRRAGGAQVILCDTSGSMDLPAGARTRIAHLRAALAQSAQPHHVLLAFSDHVQAIAVPADLPAPSGGTALELALIEAAKHDPSATLVISDGEPNQPEAALAAADRLPGRIDVIFCGDERNATAIAFMCQLARLGCGRMVVHDWATQQATPIATTMRMLLTGPRP